MVRKFPHVGNPEKNLKAAYFEVEYEEVFHMKELYKRLYEWFGMWGYDTIDPTGEAESLYMERHLGNGAQEHHIWWRFEKEINSFVKYFMKFDIQTLNMNQIEIMHKGQKAKTYKGDVIFRAEAWVMLDWKDEWKNHWLLKNFEGWYLKRWFKDKKESHKKQLWFELYSLEEMIKQYLTLNNLFEQPEPFHPKKGLP